MLIERSVYAPCPDQQLSSKVVVVVDNYRSVLIPPLKPTVAIVPQIGHATHAVHIVAPLLVRLLCGDEDDLVPLGLPSVRVSGLILGSNTGRGEKSKRRVVAALVTRVSFCPASYARNNI